METSNKTARELYEAVKANPSRQRFGFGRKPALVNVDLQCAYTRPAEFITAYETDPKQIDYVNQLARLFRANRCPVVWTYVAYLDSDEHCGVWGTRSDTPDSLQNIKPDSRSAQLDEPCEIDRAYDIVFNNRMASAFFETNLGSLFTFHKVDTVIVTVGSTSRCLRATVVPSQARHVRTVVPTDGLPARPQLTPSAN